MKPFWVTFYSYKGGVGRSLALANTAALLAQEGRRVVLIDFDLEAPGLDSFSEFSSAAGQPGVVEYVSEFTRTKVAPPISSFVRPCILPGYQRGKLWLMPAGRKDGPYNRHLRTIDWSGLYETGFGFHFFENWKASINSEYKPDYVFVDSRTGLTEIGGVCTTQFPDLVVMLFGLNEQNIRGIATVAKHIRESDETSVRQLHFVASPVPNLAPEQRILKGRNTIETGSQVTDRIAIARECLGTKAISSLRYFAPAALSEKLFVLDEEMGRQPLILDYQNLRRELTAFNRTGLDFILEQAEEALAESDFPKAERITAVLKRDFHDRAEAILIMARTALIQGNQEQAISLGEASLELDDTFDGAFNFLRSQYTKSEALDKLAALYDRITSGPKNIHPERLANIHQQRAELMMHFGRYQEAEKSYSICYELEKAHESVPSLRLIMEFNLAEAHRRSTGEIDKVSWQQVISTFVHAGAASDQPLNTQANQWQAMHIAYACVGNIDIAKDCLRKAKRAAETIGEIEEIFSVRGYREVEVAEFLEDVDLMQASLERGQLWDGFSLP